MEQFKQYGIISLLGIVLFCAIYSSIELFEWQFFPWLQIGILSFLTLSILIVHILFKEKANANFIYSTWGFVILEWLVCLVLFNLPQLIPSYFHFIFLPLVIYFGYALQNLYERRGDAIQRQGRWIFYGLIASLIVFFLFPRPETLNGLYLIFTVYILRLLISPTKN